MSEEAKAVQEVAKAAGKAIDAASDLGNFLGKYVGGPVETAVGILHDRLIYVRWERSQRLIERAEEYARKSGVSGHIEPIPLSIAAPLITSATLEEDDYLQDEWAKLLVNASDPAMKDEPYKAFIGILNSMSSYDAKMLRSIVLVPAEYTDESGYVITKGLPETYTIREDKLTSEGDNLSEKAKVSLFNLMRLGVIDKGGWGGHDFKTAFATPLGKAFVRACTIPNGANQ